MIDKISKYFKNSSPQVLKPFGSEAKKKELMLTLCERDEALAKALAEAFQDWEEVEVKSGDIFKVSAQAIVSPANSFGDMGGGLDRQIDEFYQGKAQRDVQKAIQHHFFGELPVGMAIILAMSKKKFPFLIVAPTMRIPGNIRNTIQVYLAMRAILVAVRQHNQRHPEKIRHIASPGLGTGVGGMDYSEAAKQMQQAFQNIIGGAWKTVTHPSLAPYATASIKKLNPPPKEDTPPSDSTSASLE